MFPKGRIGDPKKTPLVKAIRKVRREYDAAYRQSWAYQVEQLYKEQQMWSRRVTIASNKLRAVRSQIMTQLTLMAAELDKERMKAYRAPEPGISVQYPKGGEVGSA